MSSGRIRRRMAFLHVWPTSVRPQATIPAFPHVQQFDQHPHRPNVVGQDVDAARQCVPPLRSQRDRKACATRLMPRRHASVLCELGVCNSELGQTIIGQ